MHQSAKLRMKWFVDQYIDKNVPVRVLDVGSYDVNGSYRAYFENADIEYVGLDVCEGPNVNYVPENPYSWDELEDGYFDYVISGNAFEHIEYPWLTIEQISKKLKEGGIACVIAPNSIFEHRFPVDCYRYFSDGFRALAKWAGLTVIDATVSGIPSEEAPKGWISYHNDSMLIAIKSKEAVDTSKYPVLPYEKRYLHATEWKRRYDFLAKWIEKDSFKKDIVEFVRKGNYSHVYIYGFGTIGKMIFNELSNTDLNLHIIDRNKNVSTETEIILPGEDIVSSTSSIIICSVLDRGMLEYLDGLYPSVSKVFVDEMF